jgi:nucleoid-associated protein YgaU
MRKSTIVILALALLVSTSGTALAAEKMTREEYQAKMAEYTDREAKAKKQIDELNAQLEALKKQLDDLDAATKAVTQELLSVTGATEEEIRAYGKRLDAILKQLEGLMALAPEVLIQRRGEIKAIAAEVEELKKSKISALPEMKERLERITRMLDQLQSRTAQPVTMDYTVVRGDNLWTIAKKEEVYADPYMWPRIYRANKEKIKDPDLIYPKQTLAVPFGVGENQYLVTQGDFLYKIAAEVYNDPGKWHKIYEANKQQIVEPHLIFPAQVFDIPSN